MNADDPRCPECDGAIGLTAAYCMHCSADLTEERPRAAADAGDSNGTSRPSSSSQGPSDEPAGDGSLLAPDGLLDNGLTVVVSLIGGLVIGLIVLFVVAAVVSAGWGFTVGFLAWGGATTYLMRQRTVQAAVSMAAYGIALAIMSIPLIVFNPTWETGNYLLDLAIIGGICAVPAAIVGGVGFLASRFVPTSEPKG